MKNNFTFLTYFRSNDQDKLTRFIWNLPFKIEIKEIMHVKGKWYCYFTYPDHMPMKSSLVNLDLDKM